MSSKLAVPLVLAYVLIVGCVSAQPLRLDFSPSPLASFIQRTEAKAVMVELPQCAAAPKIDGDLSDAAWQSAATVRIPASFRGARPLPNTRAQLCYDETALYLAVACELHAGKPPVAEKRARDEGAWKDDCVEVWLDTSGKGEAVYQFVINAAGAIYDQSTAGPAYNPAWQYASGASAGAWTVEMAIPQAALQLSAWPAKLACNIGRNGPEIDPRCLSGTYGDTSAGVLVLTGITETEPEPAAGPQPAGKPLELTAQHTYARPGDRWLEAELKLGTPPAALPQAEVRAQLLKPGGGSPLAEAKALPSRSAGRVLIDMRSPNLTGAVLRVQLREQGKLVAQEELRLEARGPKQPLKPGQKIPVQLDLPPGISSVENWPVYIGIPFPTGTLWDVDAIRLVDGSGRQLPHQREAIAHWAKDGAIKWVGCDALVNSADGCFVEVATPQPVLKPQERLCGGYSDNNLIDLVNDKTGWVFAKGKSPLSDVGILGFSDHFVAISHEHEESRGLYVVDQNGRVASASAQGETMTIEASGPVAACVRFEGPYLTADGEELARHITRVEVFAKQPVASITHTLVLTRDTNEVWFTDVGWEFWTPLGRDTTALFGISREEWDKSVSCPVGADTTAYMLQDTHYFFAHGENHFAVVSQAASGKGSILAEGEECGDWAAVVNDKRGVMISCREAARQHPKEFEVRPGRLVLHLFSNRAGEELDFRGETLAKKWDLLTWYETVIPKVHKLQPEEVLAKMAGHTSNAIGWSKTHQLMIAPLAEPEKAGATAARLSRLHSQPVYALADPKWICESEAMKPMHPADEQRFPVVEKAIAAALRQWHERIGEWGDYGFVDYYMGPHLSYRGKYVGQKRYFSITYTLRPDLWLMYTRSGNREVRRFASDSIRADADGTMAHWDGPLKTRGLYISDSGSDLPVGGVRKGQLPFYWESATYLHKSSSTTMDNYAWQYYLTGDRRAKDTILEYCDGIKRAWTPAQAKRDGRPLVILRMLTGGYACTWDPELRALAEATVDMLENPEAPLGFIQVRSNFDQPYSTTYKTQVDIRALIEAWRVFGTPRYYNMAMRLSRYLWQNYLGEWPHTYTNPTGVAGSFLYHETGEPKYAQGLAIQVRQAASAYDPQTDGMSGIDSAEKTSFLFEGVAHAQEVLVSSGADKGPVSAWCGYENFGFASSIVFHKAAGEELEFDIQTPAGFKIVPVGKRDQAAAGLPWIVEETYGNRSISVPAEAPAGDYEIVPGDFGQQLVVANSHLPLVIHAPDYWRPAPAQAPSIRYYFRLPANATAPKLLFEGSAKLFGPDGQPYREGEEVHGVVDLPVDQPGLWSFMPVDNQLVRAHNIPPFFAVEDPASYFEPAIPWESQQPEPERVEIAPDTEYVKGAIATPGNQALYLGGRRKFTLQSAEPHASGDGTKFLPFKEGTIEFFLKPSWDTVELPLKSRTICMLGVESGETWRMSYMMAPRQRDAKLDFFTSHVLYGYFMSDGPQKRTSMRAYRRTVFSADHWVHVAWVWGYRGGLIPGGGGTRPAEEVLVTELYLDGRKGQHYNYKWLRNLPADMPVSFAMYSLDAAVDELRISDRQRYTHDFAPPSRERELELDEHTRALFHFNGEVEGISHGHEATVPAVVQ